MDNIAVAEAHTEQHEKAAPVYYLVKWKPRQESPEQWLAYAEEHGEWSAPRPGKRVALLEVRETRTHDGYEYLLRRVMRVIERTIVKHGQHLLVPETELEGWWTSLAFDEGTIIALDADHGTSEQCHSHSDPPFLRLILSPELNAGLFSWFPRVVSQSRRARCRVQRRASPSYKCEFIFLLPIRAIASQSRHCSSRHRE